MRHDTYSQKNHIGEGTYEDEAEPYRRCTPLGRSLAVRAGSCGLRRFSTCFHGKTTRLCDLFPWGQPTDHSLASTSFAGASNAYRRSVPAAGRLVRRDETFGRSRLPLKEATNTLL